MNFAEEIIALKDADLTFRDQLMQSGQLNEGYHPEMERIHNENAAALEKIIDRIGYPTSEKVGLEASEKAWLVIQHAIGQPTFMRKCRDMLANELQGSSSSISLTTKVARPLEAAHQLAYLSDRIAVFEGGPQLYGTQFDWDENGLLSPQPFDDLDKVNERRKALDLNPLEEQIAIMRARPDNQQPPSDLKKLRQAYEAWRVRVGWDILD